MFCFNYSSSRHPALCPTTVDAPHHGNNINVLAVSSTDSYGSIFNWFNVSSMSLFLKHWKHNFGFLVRIQQFNRSLVCGRTMFCCEIIYHHTLFLANLPSAKVSTRWQKFTNITFCQKIVGSEWSGHSAGHNKYCANKWGFNNGQIKFGAHILEHYLLV